MITVFADESGADGTNRYMVHGVLFVRHAALDPMRREVGARLASSRFPDELKWSTLTKKRFTRDLRAVSTFFEVFESGGESSSARFQCLVVDQHKVDVRSFHNDDSDMCFYKFLYRLLLKRIGEMSNPGERVRIVLDYRHTRGYEVKELRPVLQNGLNKEFGGSAPYMEHVRYANSRDEPLLQITDFLTGAVAFHRNGHDRSENCSMAKRFAADWLARKVGVRRLDLEQRKHPKFGIWTLRLQDKRPPHRLAA